MEQNDLYLILFVGVFILLEVIKVIDRRMRTKASADGIITPEEEYSGKVIGIISNLLQKSKDYLLTNVIKKSDSALGDLNWDEFETLAASMYSYVVNNPGNIIPFIFQLIVRIQSFAEETADKGQANKPIPIPMQKWNFLKGKE